MLPGIPDKGPAMSRTTPEEVVRDILIFIGWV